MELKHEYDASTELGLPVTLIDAVTEHDDGSIEIPNIEVLLASVAVTRALIPIQMVGSELRFIRHVLNLTGTEFADAIGLSEKSVVSRWENDKTRAGGYTEKVIRQLILNLLGDRATGIDVDRYAIPSMRIRVRDVKEGPLPMAFRLEHRAIAKGEAQFRYAVAA